MLLQLAQEPIFLILWVVAILVALTIHEFAHAAVALAMGDDTAQKAGRVTLNPLPHIDATGFLMLLLAGFGWAKPVPVNPARMRDSRLGSVLTTLAGPGANLAGIAIFGGLLAAAVRFVPDSTLLIAFLTMITQLNVILMVFNLLPIPPLDGANALFAILPASYDRFKVALMRYGPLLLIMFIALDAFSGNSVLARAFNWVWGLVTSVIL